MENVKILLCEDDENLGMLLKEYLQAKGLDVDLLPDGEAGYQAFINDKYDLCVLDIMMPNISGWEVFGELKKNPEWQNIPVIFLTARSDHMAKSAGYFLGEDYIKKPYELEEVKNRIDKILNKIQ